MTCEQPDEHQLNLDLNSYQVFKDNLVPCICKEWEWKPQAHNPSVSFLATWAETNDFVGCATWTKKMLLELTGDQVVPAGCHLVRAFGHAFPGNDVGALGRDIVEYTLKRPFLALRRTAVEVLERWLEDDEDGIWLDLLNDHIDFESDRELKSQCTELVQAWMEFDDDDEEDPPELEEYLKVGRQLPNRARALLETRALPGFLEKMADVDQRLALAAIESVNIGKLVTESHQHGFFLSRVGHGWQFRCWRIDGRSSFSIEPTATDDNWLVFTRFSALPGLHESGVRGSVGNAEGRCD